MNILIISTVGLIYDGITNVIMSYLRKMNRTGLNIYIAVTIQSESEIKHEMEELGCYTVDLPDRRKKPVTYLLALSSFIRKKRIQVVHAHGNSGTLAVEMLAGFFGGSKKRIAHSHNTRCDQIRADKLLRPLFYALYTDAIACGEEAGKWLFGKRPFIILKNGREIPVYRYHSNTRKKIRQKLGVHEDTFVLGHVGGFVCQKNHPKIVGIFRQLLKMQQNSMLVLIGDGPTKEEIVISCQDISNRVVFIGNVNNVGEYLNAMDVMVLPSFFEGLPLVAIEWQINGLPCIISDVVTQECKVSENVKFLSLNESEQFWAKEILICNGQNNRREMSEKAIVKIKDAGFDISDSAEILRKIYLSEEKKKK